MGPIFGWVATALLGILVIYVVHATVRSVLIGIPPDYFVQEAPHRTALEHGVRTVVGATLIVLGILMLALPGPGLLTIVAGALVMDGGHKRAIVRRVLGSRRIGASIDSLRRRAGEAPLVMP